MEFSTKNLFRGFEMPAFIDTHVHWRDDLEYKGMISSLIGYSIMGGAYICMTMPNPKGGLITPQQTIGYRNECVLKTPTDLPFGMKTIPCIQITEGATKETIDSCLSEGIMDAKVYPFMRTTKSDKGVRDYHKLVEIVTYAVTKGMRVHHHPEHPDMLFINRDAEYGYIPIMDMFMRAMPNDAKGCHIWEHATDIRCAPFWRKWAETGNFFVTITAHHLATHEDETYGDVHAVCKPSYKTAQDMSGLQQLVAEDLPWVMAGTDTAPHDVKGKHVNSGQCACGAFTAPFAVALYAHALRQLLMAGEGYKTFMNFMHYNAAKLYGINSKDAPILTVSSESTEIPNCYSIGDANVVPFWAGRTLGASILLP